MNVNEKPKNDIAIARKALQLEYAFTHGVNFESNSIVISEDIHEDLFQWFDAAMTELEYLTKKNITIKINSYGGDMYESMAIVSRIRKSKRQIIIEGYGKIMSSAFLILISGDKRLMCKYAYAMHHACSYDMDHDKLIQHKDYLEQAQREERRRHQMFEDFTTTDAQTWEAMAGYKDTYLTAQQCLELGAVDEIF